MPVVFITRYFPGDAAQRLAESCEVRFRRRLDPIGRDEMLRGLQEADAVITAGDPVDADMLANAPRLAVVADMWGAAAVDRAACEKRGIRVIESGYTIQWISVSEAEHTIMLMLAVGRSLLEMDAYVRSGRYHHEDAANRFFLGQGLHGRRLGILGGADRAGEDLAVRARGLGMEVCYCDDRPAPGYTALGVPCVPFETLLGQSDFVALISCKHDGYLLDKHAFDRMKPGAILTNVTSGKLIDERELVRALTDGRLGGAGLDKLEHEPVPVPGLTQLKNVVLTPHSDGALFDVRSRIFTILAERCLNALSATETIA